MASKNEHHRGELTPESKQMLAEGYEFPEEDQFKCTCGADVYVQWDSYKKEHLHIKIPDIKETVLDLLILGSFDNKDWENRIDVTTKLLDWMQQYSSEYSSKSNHQTIIIKWNKLNKWNPTAPQLEYTK